MLLPTFHINYFLLKAYTYRSYALSIEIRIVLASQILLLPWKENKTKKINVLDELATAVDKG